MCAPVGSLSFCVDLVHLLPYTWPEGKIMKKLVLVVFGLVSGVTSFSQTCTVTGSINWPSTTGAGVACVEGGNAAGKSILVIPAGVTVTFNDNNDSWTGTQIEIFGTMIVTANPTVNASVIVKDGGLLDLQGKLEIGSSAGCPYTLVVATGGSVTLNTTSSDRLAICGVDVMKGGGSGSCNDCGGTNSGQCPYDGKPYCQPPGGFTGPAGYDDDGFDSTLPVKLLYFNVSAEEENVKLQWATAMEENFYKFVIQRSKDGLTYDDIGEVEGQGFNIYEVESKYVYDDEAPLIGVNYYRLKAVDLDDSFEYFQVKMVKLNGAKKMTVYPNPSSGDVIAFRTNFDGTGADRVMLLDQLGTEIFNAPVSETNSINFQNRLRQGVYLLRYVSDGFEQTTRIVIKN